MKFVTKHKWDCFCIIIITAISIFVTTRNFRSGYSLIGGDAGAVQEYPISAFKEALFVWFDRDNTGSQFGVNPSSLFPYLALLAFLKYLGFSAIFGQKVFFFLMFFVSGISAYYLVKMFISRFPMGVLLGALFYMFNHYTMVTWSSALSNYSFTYMLMPVFIALYIKGLNTNGSRYAILFGMAAVIGLGGNLSLVAVVLFALGFYLIFYMISERKILKPLWFSFRIFVISVIFNLWWCIPTMLSMQGLAENVQARGNLGWLDWMNSRTSFLNLFRLDGYTGWLEFFPYGPNFTNKIVLVVIGYFIPLLAVSSIFWMRKYKKIGYFMLLALVSMFLAKGKHSPAGWVYLWLFKYIPGFGIFRSSYDKFIPLAAISYSCLISIAVYELYIFAKRWSSWLAKAGAGSVLLIVALYSYPFWKGNIIRAKPGEAHTFFVKIPAEYNDASKWINGKKDDFRIFAIPQKSGDYIDYGWGYFGPSIDRYLYDKPVIMDTFFKDILWIFDKARDIASILKLISVKYILLHFDSFDYADVYKTEKFIKKNNDIKKEKDSGILGLYSINQKYFLPKCYIADRSVFVTGRDNSYRCLSYLANHGFLKGRLSIIFNQLENNNLSKNMFNEIIMCNKRGLDGPADMNSIKTADILWDKREDFIKGEFYIPKTSAYNIKVDITPKFMPYFREKEISFNENMGDRNNLNNWALGANTAEYKLGRIYRMLFADLNFEQNDKADEYIQLKRRAINVDLDKTPFFVMTYMVEDPRVQTVQVVLGLDFNKDGKVDGHIKNIYELWSPTFLKEYIYNTREIAEILYPGKLNYEVKYIEIYPHKKWGVDCSGNWKGKYRFYIANLKFCNFEKEREYFEERENVMDIDYNAQKNNLQKQKYTADSRICYELSQDVRGINLKKYPTIDFKCVGHWDHINRVELVFDLDFDGDNKKDAEETALALYRIPNAARQEFSINAKNIIKYKYRNKKCVNLLNVRWKAYCRKAYREKGLFLFKVDYLKVFSRKLISPAGQDIILSVFKLDNKGYSMKKKIADRKELNNIEFKIGKVKLNKGWHSIFNLLTKDDNFKIDSVSIREEGFNKKVDEHGRVVKYEKINPTRYKIDATIEKPSWIVFNETFDSKWKAYIYNDQRLATSNQRPAWSALWQMWKDRGNRFELKNHYMVNGYANGWYIPKVGNSKPSTKLRAAKSPSEIRNEDINIVIEYIPQRWFELGILVSGMAMVLGASYLWLKK